MLDRYFPSRRSPFFFEGERGDMCILVLLSGLPVTFLGARLLCQITWVNFPSSKITSHTLRIDLLAVIRSRDMRQDTYQVEADKYLLMSLAPSPTVPSCYSRVAGKEQRRSGEAYEDSRASASSSASSEPPEIPPEWEVSPASVPCRERMEGCRSRVLKVSEAKRSSGELQESLPEPSSRSVPNGYLLEYIKVESPYSKQRARRRGPSTKPPTQSRPDSASASESNTAEGKAWHDPREEGTTPPSGGGVSNNATGSFYRDDGGSSRSDAPTALTLSRNARLFLDFEEGLSLDVHLHLSRYGEFEGGDKRVLQSMLDGIEVFLGYEHTAAEHLAFGTYFYYRGKGQVRGRGSGAPLPPGSARSAEEAGAMSRWARAAEKEDAVQRAFTHFQKAYEIVQRKGGKKGGALTDKEWRSLMNHYGVLASARSGLEKASAVFEQAVRDEPSNARFRYNLACVRAEMGKKEGMLEELERALVLQSRGEAPESKLAVNPSKDLAFRDFWHDPDFRRLVDLYASTVSC